MALIRMKKSISGLLLLAAAMLYSSCSTDFNTAAPYKETMVIYGLLNSSDSTQYIRISKAYLGEGNSLIMAQQKDSIYYGDILDVKLLRMTNGVLAQTIPLTRDTTVPKNPGIFAAPYQVVYKCTTPVAGSGSTYKLVVHNNQTGLTAESETNMVDSVRTEVPQTVDFTSPIQYTVRLDAVTNGWVYNATFRFRYKEVNLVSGQTTSKYVDWNLGDDVNGESGLAILEYTRLYRPDLYRIIGQTLSPVDTNVIRRIIDSPPIEIVATAATENMYIYSQLTQPSFGIVQERPTFSNIDNGIGLFSSRNVKAYARNFDAAGHSYHAFDTSRYTKTLYFVHP